MVIVDLAAGVIFLKKDFNVEVVELFLLFEF